jgi:hypothetical protein
MYSKIKERYKDSLLSMNIIKFYEAVLLWEGEHVRLLEEAPSANSEAYASLTLWQKTFEKMRTNKCQHFTLGRLKMSRACLTSIRRLSRIWIFEKVLILLISTFNSFYANVFYILHL